MKIEEWIVKAKTDERSVIRLMIKGYFLLLIICFLIIVFPFSKNQSVGLVDSLFLASSIVSTTGLSPVNFGETFNWFGQFASLLFIQLGGIGYMALGSFIIIKKSKHLPKLPFKLLQLEFNLPTKYPTIQFAYTIVFFTLFIELLGCIWLSYEFSNLGIENPIWNGLFHSISAFCTAGFSLFTDGMAEFQDNSKIIWCIQILSIWGSLGFIVLLDFTNFCSGKKKFITLTTKIIVIGTFLMWFLGALFIFIGDSTLVTLGWDGVEIALFQSMAAHTTVGFNNYGIGELAMPSLFIMIMLMIIGASPAGTGGGIKTTSITALFAVLKSILVRREEVTFLKRQIPVNNIYLAIASALFYLVILSVGCFFLFLFDGEQFDFMQLFFEASSALSTVGLSTGITADLSNSGKILLSLMMFIGRLGVLTFGLSLLNSAPNMTEYKQPEEIAI